MMDLDKSCGARGVPSWISALPRSVASATRSVSMSPNRRKKLAGWVMTLILEVSTN